MSLPASGTIRLSEIKTEFGKGNNLLDYLGEGGVTGSAPLSLRDFYGTSAKPPDIINMPGVGTAYKAWIHGYPHYLQNSYVSWSRDFGAQVMINQTSTMKVEALAPGFQIPAGAGEVTYKVDYTVRVACNDFNSSMSVNLTCNFDSSSSSPKTGFQSAFIRDKNTSSRLTSLAMIAQMYWSGGHSGTYGFYKKSVDGVMEDAGTYSNSQASQLKSFSGTTYVTIDSSRGHCQLGIMTSIPSKNGINTGAHSVIDSLVVSPVTREADLEFAQAAAALNAAHTAEIIAEDEAYEAEELARIEAGNPRPAENAEDIAQATEEMERDQS